MDKFFKNTVLGILSVAIIFIVSEVIARVVYVQPWYTRLIGKEEVMHVSKNELMLRDPYFLSLKSSNCKRVLILGDSFTSGFRIKDDSKIFSTILEKRLNVEFSRHGEKIEIFNGGLTGSLTADWVKLLLQMKDTFKPDVILIVFFLRDGTLTNIMEDFYGSIRKEIISRKDRSFLYRHVYLFRIIQDCLDRLYLSMTYSAGIRESYLGSPEQTTEWENAKNNIMKINSIGKDIHAKVGLVVYPILVELNRNYPFKDVCDCIMKFAAQQHMPRLSLLPAFMGKYAPDLWISAYNQHPNEQAHSIVANAILPFLKDLLISSGKGYDDEPER